MWKELKTKTELQTALWFEDQVDKALNSQDQPKKKGLITKRRLLAGAGATVALGTIAGGLYLRESRNRSQGIQVRQVTKDVKIIETESRTSIAVFEYNQSTSMDRTYYFFNEMQGLLVKVYPQRIKALEKDARLGFRVPQGQVHLTIFEPTQLYGKERDAFRTNMQNNKINPILRAQGVNATAGPMSIYLDTLVAQELKDSGEVIPDRLSERASLLWAEALKSRYSPVAQNGIPQKDTQFELIEAVKRNPPIEVVIGDLRFIEFVKRRILASEMVKTQGGQMEMLLDYKAGVGVPNALFFNYTPGVKAKVRPEVIQKIYIEEGINMPREYKIITVLSPATANPEIYNKVDEEFRKNEEERLLSQHYQGQEIKYQVLHLYMHQAVADTVLYRPQYDDNEKRAFLSRELSFRWIELMKGISDEVTGKVRTKGGITEATEALLETTPPIEILSIDPALIERLKNQQVPGAEGR